MVVMEGEGEGGGGRVLRAVDSGRYIGSRVGSKTAADARGEDRDGVVVMVVVRGADVPSACNNSRTKPSNDTFSR